jgi:hypothetical protein
MSRHDCRDPRLSADGMTDEPLINNGAYVESDSVGSAHLGDSVSTGVGDVMPSRERKPVRLSLAA